MSDKKEYTFEDTCAIYRRAEKVGITIGMIISAVYLIDADECVSAKEILKIDGTWGDKQSPLGVESSDWKKIKRFMKKEGAYE